MNGLRAASMAAADSAPPLRLPGAERYHLCDLDLADDEEGESSLDGGTDDESLDSLSSWRSRRAGGPPSSPPVDVALVVDGSSSRASPTEDEIGESPPPLEDRSAPAVASSDPCELEADPSPVVNGATKPTGNDPSDGENRTDDSKCDQNGNGSDASEEDMRSFFQTYLPHGENQQPLAALQTRYQTLQHRIDRHADAKSAKAWFRDGSCIDDECRGLWWRSEVVVPADVAAAWGLAEEEEGAVCYVASSNVGSRAPSEAMEAVRSICGEGKRLLSGMSIGGEVGEMWFKTKAGARKCAALHLLWTLEHGNSGNPFLSAEGAPNGFAGVDNQSTVERATEPTPNERFTLLHTKFFGTMKDKDGPVLSRDNPCLMQCILSIHDAKSQGGDPIEFRSGFHVDKNAAVDDAFDRLCEELAGVGATDENVRSILGEKDGVVRNKPVTSFDPTVPNWANAPLEERLYLYELEFAVNDARGKMAPLSEAMGIDASVATRISVILGRDLFDGHESMEKEIDSDFTMNDRQVTVKIHRRTQLDALEMDRQAKCAARRAKVPTDADAIALARCFNWTILQRGKAYGKQPIPAVKDIVSTAEGREPSGDGRTYLFLPLQGVENIDGIDARLQIDWKIILETVYDVHTRAVRRFDVDVCLPHSLAFWTSCGLLLVALMAATPSASITFETCSESLHHTRDGIHFCQRRECSSVGDVVAFFIAGMSTAERDAVILSCAISVFLLLVNALIPAKMASHSLLRNRFLQQRIGFRKRLFATTRESVHESSSSLLVPRSLVSALPDKTRDVFHYMNDGLRLEDATYARYFENMLQRPLQYPTHSLISTELAAGTFSGHDLSQFEQHCDAQPMNGKDMESISNFLAKRGRLVAELVSMLPLPRDMLYILQHQSSFMERLERRHLLVIAAMRLKEIQEETSGSMNDAKVELSIASLVDLIGQPTAVGATPSSTKIEERLESLGDSVLLYFLTLRTFSTTEMKYVLDEFEEATVSQGKNEVLRQAGMLIGLQQLCSDPNKNISDVFEAVLGSAYLIDTGCHIVIGLLNEVGSCFPRSTGPKWFVGKDTGLDGALPWSELEQISGLDVSVLSILKENASKLWQLLSTRSNLDEMPEAMDQEGSTTPNPLHCALFDDSLDQEKPDEETKRLAQLRDKVFHVGHAALQLKVVEEIYRHYPKATSGDIHLMKVTILSQDTLAYLFIKIGFHECMYDTGSEATRQMKSFVNQSDALGSEIWEKQGGWIVPSEEFRRRAQSFNVDCNILAGPQYVGLAAGRLLGQENKLPEEATDELMFSIKCIFGALVLSMGLNDAWTLIKPFFIELLLLSPEEIRSAFKDAPLVQAYARGSR